MTNTVRAVAVLIMIFRAETRSVNTPPNRHEQRARNRHRHQNGAHGQRRTGQLQYHPRQRHQVKLVACNRMADLAQSMRKLRSRSGCWIGAEGFWGMDAAAIRFLH